MDLMIEHTGKGFITMLLLSMPAVLLAAGIGLVVGILQAVTQVQEQTIAAAPKVFGVFLLIIMMGPFSAEKLIDYFKTSANIAFDVIPRDEAMVLSGNDFFKYKQKSLEDQFYGAKVPDLKEAIRNPGKVPYSGAKYKESRQIPPKDSISQPNLIEKKQIYSGNKK
ncbi:MAG TPA: flagellar biosynthetic protein FliQ [Candidatus Gastranaerophilales bacterium]|nr:flagellar biosynthetic protein FliQ [Candidatus Gastranaerophilales bacterium]